MRNDDKKYCYLCSQILDDADIEYSLENTDKDNYFIAFETKKKIRKLYCIDCFKDCRTCKTPFFTRFSDNEFDNEICENCADDLIKDFNLKNLKIVGRIVDGIIYKDKTTEKYYFLKQVSGWGCFLYLVTNQTAINKFKELDFNVTLEVNIDHYYDDMFYYIAMRGHGRYSNDDYKNYIKVLNEA